MTSPAALSAAALHTPMLDLLRCRYPIMLAGMGGVARSALAAAVAHGGLERGGGCGR